MEFGLRVKRLRRELDLTQQELADKAGVGQSTIGQIESGRNKSIKADKLLSLAQALNTTTEYLINGTQDNNSQINAQNNSGTQNNLGAGNQTNTINNNFFNDNATPAQTKIMPDNSMTPVIPENTPLWIDKNDTNLRNGKIYLIQYGGMEQIRKLFAEPNNQIRLIPYNTQEYNTYTAPAEQVAILGRVTKWEVSDN